MAHKGIKNITSLGLPSIGPCTDMQVTNAAALSLVAHTIGSNFHNLAAVVAAAAPAVAGCKTLLIPYNVQQ